MRLLAPLELLTAILYGYLGLALPWNTAFSIVQGLHFAVVVVAGIMVAVGAWQRARWVPKASVLLAAWVGIPTFASAAGIVRIVSLHASPAVGLSFGMVVLAAICQLLALMLALGSLDVRDTGT